MAFSKIIQKLVDISTKFSRNECQRLAGIHLTITTGSSQLTGTGSGVKG